MDKVRVLCEMDQYMMRAFSRDTSEALKKNTLFRLLLPPFQSFLDANVKKEEEKDFLVISSAYQARQGGKSLEEIPITSLLQEARKIDQKFFQQTSALPFSIEFKYNDIEKIRRLRMEQLFDTSYRLFQQWEKTPRIRTAFARLYSRNQFLVLLREILHLYSQETKILSRSVRLPHLIGVARDKLSNTIYSVMEDVSQQLVTELTQIMYRRNV